MNNWANEWAVKIKRQNDDKAQKNATLVEEQKLKTDLGPVLWAAVREEVNTNCEALNKEMSDKILTYEFTPQGGMSVVGNLNGRGKELRAAFNVETGTLNWDSAGCKDSVVLTMSRDGKGATFVPTFVRGTQLTPQSIARQMLDSLLESCGSARGLF
jgi:hypothetical protein